jgi:redox-regulated HSP33 family molecular chaperone
MPPKVAAYVGASAGLPSSIFTRLKLAAVSNAQPLHRAGGWPVVLFSTGYGVERQLYTGLVQDLASHGYVVAAIDHPHDANIVAFPDGHAVRIGKVGQSGNAIAKALTVRIADTRYQGMVPVEGGDLAHAFEHYFERSEQLPTRIVLAEANGRCGGLMLQQIAREGGAGATDEDGWNRSNHLLATMSKRELLELAPEQLLLRLFHEEGVRLQPAQPIEFACTCSRERVEAMLRSLGRAESDATLAEQGSVDVHCEFCNRRYVFDDKDIAELFAGEVAAGAPTTRH